MRHQGVLGRAQRPHGTGRALVMSTIWRVVLRSIRIAPVPGVDIRACRRQAVAFSNEELMVLPGAKHEPTPPATNDVARQRELEVAMSKAVLNLGEDSLQGSIERCG